MRPDWWSEAEREANSVVEGFTAKLLEKLAVPPEKIISRKNPFLFRMRADSSVHSLAQMVIDAYMSSSEETIFGSVLEAIAEVVCRHGRGGRKSAAGGVDLEYDMDNGRTIAQVKSGVNWGNSSQKQAMKAAFKTAATILRQGNRNLYVRCVEGCAYGRSEIKDLGTHYRIVGNSFWEEISGWNGTAGAVMELLGRHASNGLNDARAAANYRMVDYLKRRGVVGPDDRVLWDKLLTLVMEPRISTA